MIPESLIDSPTVRAVLAYVASNPETTFGVVAGLLTAGGSYAKTGTIPLGRIPYRHLRRLLRDLGDTYFGTSRPTGVPAILVDAPPDKVEKEIRQHDYESGDLYSYEYSGEVWNLRRPDAPDRDEQTGRLVPMEVHARGFRTEDDGTLVLAHHEANRWEATTAHIDETMMSWPKGRDIISDDLDAEGVDHRLIDSEAGADVQVVS